MAVITCGCNPSATQDVNTLGADTGAIDCLSAPMTVTLGTGYGSILPLADRDPIGLHRSSLGGWYFEMALLVEHTPENVGMLPVVTAIGVDPPAVIAGYPATQFHTLRNYDEATCSGSFWGLRAYVDIDFVPPEVVCTLDGQPVEISVTVSEIIPLPTETEVRSVTGSVVATVEILATSTCP